MQRRDYHLLGDAAGCRCGLNCVGYVHAVAQAYCVFVVKYLIMHSSNFRSIH